MNKHFITIGGNKEFVSGPAAMVELEKQFMHCARSIGEDKDVLVFLEPDNVPLLEVRGRENHTELVCEPHILTKHPKGSRSKVATIPHAEVFCASIDVRPMKGKTKTLTKFLHH